MHPGPLLPNLQQLFAGLEQRLGPLLLTIGCDCFLRRLEIENDGGVESVATLLRQQRSNGSSRSIPVAMTPTRPSTIRWYCPSRCASAPTR